MLATLIVAPIDGLIFHPLVLLAMGDIRLLNLMGYVYFNPNFIYAMTIPVDYSTQMNHNMVFNYIWGLNLIPFDRMIIKWQILGDPSPQTNDRKQEFTCFKKNSGVKKLEGFPKGTKKEVENFV